MDAKVDGWVVTPRRGKAVEINALWYNALRILEQLLIEKRTTRTPAAWTSTRPAPASRSTNASGMTKVNIFTTWSMRTIPRCANQIFSISLDFPVLDESRWRRVVSVVQDELLTPVGLDHCRDKTPITNAPTTATFRSRDAPRLTQPRGGKRSAARLADGPMRGRISSARKPSRIGGRC